MLARTVTHALVGIDPRRVEVEAHIQRGLSSFAIVGLADRACQEAKERVRSSLAAAELEWPAKRRITVNLAPASVKKEGSGFDLPIALALLAASYQVPSESLDGHAAFGELGLDGRLRPVPGALVAAEGARRAGLDLPRVRRRVGAGGRARRVSSRSACTISARQWRTCVASARRPRWRPRPTTSRHSPASPTSPTCEGRSARGARSRSPRPVPTTCCSPGRREPARRCSPGACRGCCRCSTTRRRSR